MRVPNRIPPSTTLAAMHVDAIFAGIGRFSVRFRWLMALAWIAGVVAAGALLPSLSSVTQNDNTKFLPASAPVEHAIALAAPFGNSALPHTTVIAARPSGHITTGHIGALLKLGHSPGGVATVIKVSNLTVSGAG